MARKSKRFKLINPDESVQNYFGLIKEELTAAEFDSITEGYECLRQLVEPSMYSEVAMALTTAALARRKMKDAGLTTLNKVVIGALDDPLVANAIYNTSSVRLRELKGEEATYVVEDTEEVIESNNKHFVKKISK